MGPKYLIAKATNSITRETVMMRDLNGARFTESQRKLAQDFADKYADKLTTRTGVKWTGSLHEYKPGIVRA